MSVIPKNNNNAVSVPNPNHNFCEVPMLLTYPSWYGGHKKVPNHLLNIFHFLRMRSANYIPVLIYELPNAENDSHERYNISLGSEVTIAVALLLNHFNGTRCYGGHTLH
jgi:hypothetical protein